MNLNESFYTFLSERSLTVISTISTDNNPEAAVIGFGQTKDLEIVFGTDNSSRKYKNLLTNPKVAFVIGWEKTETVQYEGTARELSVEELSVVCDNYWKKNPHAEAHHKNPGQRYFIVTPTYIRYTNIGIKPWDIKEIAF
jgi:pyridoxine/pyridoxamine 5'-phosphate oxidase